MNDALCPCGNNVSYIECCGRFHNGSASASTAEALMRSRYSAFMLENAEYLLHTFHPSRHSPDELEKIRRSFAGTQWKGLVILNKAHGDKDDTTGTVEFIASYEAQGRPGQLHERSRFIRENDVWFYLDGEMMATPTPGRNDPCWCGSGKKFKKCHG